MVRYIEFETLIAIHAELMERLGAVAQPVLQEAELRLALSRPRASAHAEGATLIGQAARLTAGIARANGFAAGNKPTAYAALLVFLAMNDLQIIGSRLYFGPLIDYLSGPAVSDEDAVHWLELGLRPQIIPVNPVARRPNP